MLSIKIGNWCRKSVHFKTISPASQSNKSCVKLEQILPQENGLIRFFPYTFMYLILLYDHIPRLNKE